MLDDLDEYEKRILAILQLDASRSTTDIAQEIGLSQAPCWRRIQRLKDEGYIRSQVCVLDRRKLGLRAQIFAQVKLNAHGRAHLAEFSDAIQGFSEVLDCFVLMGSTDFMLRIVTRDIETYERFFFDKLSQVPGVQEVNSMVALSEIKSTTALPLDLTEPGS
ncbi:Lrp/AsnC family transcriptional regulator [Novosphingobium terrae]|jgi:Lrp/AsnC family transcriptional regulator|uniref:Lrp/AsnC family transcriptional regulator n=1 Tax=Novosphingobium terrae TaxID=2726189 RepID=UPI001981641D|nr:Lrp/AsnC family transcriptional regulator [Novosphingobium terrae]